MIPRWLLTSCLAAVLAFSASSARSQSTPTSTPASQPTPAEEADSAAPYIRSAQQTGLLDYGKNLPGNNASYNAAVGPADSVSSPEPRAYLRDIRQLLCWIIGLMLVMLTKQVLHVDR